ncbi:MAG: GNAT family N-acetyltransferase [Minwuia sp.]|nr:GNAT family N-acetyltransferase [Minwuia sp.]
MSIRFETVGVEAAHLIAALHATAVDDAWNDLAFAETLGMSGMLACVALESDDNPVGFVLLRKVLDEAEVILVAVDRARRRQGIARRLLTHVLAEHDGLARAYLEVASDNLAAIALYQALGFTEVGRRRGYYKRAAGDPVDAHVMGISLPLPCRAGA